MTEYEAYDLAMTIVNKMNNPIMPTGKQTLTADNEYLCKQLEPIVEAYKILKEEYIMDDFKNFLKENNYEGDSEFQLCDLELAFNEGRKLNWIPSDEQLDALHDAAVYVDKSMFPYPKGILMKLYKQMKKLREE